MNLADSFPLLQVVGVTPMVHKLAYQDSKSPESPRRAAARRSCKCSWPSPKRTSATATPPASSGATPAARSKCDSSPPTRGSGASYFARWVSQRGEFSGYSNPIHMRIAG